jgi:hypothetical protein
MSHWHGPLALFFKRIQRTLSCGLMAPEWFVLFSLRFRTMSHWQSSPFDVGACPPIQDLLCVRPPKNPIHVSVLRQQDPSDVGWILCRRWRESSNSLKPPTVSQFRYPCNYYRYKCLPQQVRHRPLGHSSAIRLCRTSYRAVWYPSCWVLSTDI